MHFVAIGAYAVMVGIAAGFYFYPAVIAFRLRHPQKWLILLATFLTAWTTIGWIVALIWARRVPGEHHEFVDAFTDPQSMKAISPDAKLED